jgi:hypothetical protein
MKKKTILALTFVFAVAVVAFLLPALGPRAQAQQACTEFRAIGQATLPTPHPLLPTDTWGGDVYGNLGGEFLSGIFSGNDGDTSEHGMTGMGTNGSYTFVFGTDSFTMEVGHAAWPSAPGKVGFLDYRGQAKIVEGSGTGRFQYASGNLQWAGPAIVWPDQSSPFGVQGRFNAEIRGNICGVQ